MPGGNPTGQGGAGFLAQARHPVRETPAIGAARRHASGSSFRVVQLDGSGYTDVAEPGGSDHANVVQLDRSEYTEVR